MKILLLGEFSGLHAALRDGLRALGHDAFVASYGDGWKKIECDIQLGSPRSGVLGKVSSALRPLSIQKKLHNFDIVQVITPMPFNGRFGLNRYLLEGIFNSSGKKFFCAAGDTCYLWNARTKFRYNWLDDFIKYDRNGKMPFWNSNSGIAQTEWLIDQVDGVISVMHEYSVAYDSLGKRLKYIPLPVNVDNAIYTSNESQGKLAIFHGLNREGFKGTRYVKDAFNCLAEKYSNDLELIVKGNMPLRDYLKLLERVNVVVDQTSSYSLGLNALISMSMGKIVLGGVEPESLSLLGINSSPAVNILPSAIDIVSKVEEVLDRRSELQILGAASREYVKTHHSHINVAQKYLDFWGE